MTPHDKIRHAIIAEGNGGLHTDEIVYATGLPITKVRLTLAAMLAASSVIECEPGCWMVAT